MRQFRYNDQLVDLEGLDWVDLEDPDTKEWYDRILQRICDGLVTVGTEVDRITYVMPARFIIEMKLCPQEQGSGQAENNESSATQGSDS
jgi:hypothetical protein